MTIIDGITDAPKQQFSLAVSDGSFATFYLEYRPNQLAWSFNLTWGDFQLNGQRLVSAPNILRQFTTQIPFGIAVVANGDVDPLNQADLSDGRVTLYLLDATDVADIEAGVFTGD